MVLKYSRGSAVPILQLVTVELIGEQQLEVAAQYFVIAILLVAVCLDEQLLASQLRQHR